MTDPRFQRIFRNSVTQLRLLFLSRRLGHSIAHGQRGKTLTDSFDFPGKPLKFGKKSHSRVHTSLCQSAVANIVSERSTNRRTSSQTSRIRRGKSGRAKKTRIEVFPLGTCVGIESDCPTRDVGGTPSSGSGGSAVGSAAVEAPGRQDRLIVSRYWNCSRVVPREEGGESADTLVRLFVFLFTPSRIEQVKYPLTFRLDTSIVVNCLRGS